MTAPEQPPSLTRVTRAMVGIYKTQFGRGPTHAYTNFSGPNALVCTLEGTLTPVEQTMVEIGQEQRLRELRMMFQHTAEAKFRGAVEEATGRRVVAFTSGMDVNADIATEYFLLEPPD
jgi:uncharacterized protein YbcI